MYGGMEINGKMYLWDYAEDRAVPESEMPKGSGRWTQSERAKYAEALPGSASKHYPLPAPLDRQGEKS